MTPSLATQIISPILLLVGTFFSGILPIAVRKILLNCGCDGTTCKPNCRARKGKVITSFLIYLGGGVLLATCLVHLLPEAREGFENSKSNATEPTPETSPEENNDDHDDGDHDDGDHEHFSMPEFVVCLGFFAVYLVEEVIHFFLDSGHHSHTHIPTETRAIRSFSRSSSSHSVPQSSNSNAFAEELKPEAICKNLEEVSDGGKTSCCADVGFSVTSLLTVAALSFHSLFEGFAIGLQDSDSKLWILLAAVSVHKLVISFVVGLEVLASGGKDQLVFIYMSVFAAMSPMGMVIAMITNSQVEETAPLASGILNAIATGTLLYVTFCEILQREEEHKNLPGWMQFLATFIGFVIMCIVQLISTLA